MTTLTLLLAAIRDHRAATENSSHRDRVNEKYLFNKWEEGQPTKILPTQADRGSYLACIHNTAHAGDADPIGAAYRFFRAQLVEVDDPDDDLDIERLEDAVIAGLSVVCVTAQAGDNVHRIFESLNNTGLRLTQGDLIRNYIFMRLPTRGDVVYRSHWLPLQERLDSQQLELLFWLDLVQSDGSAKQSNTYALQQARMDRLESEEDIEAEVERFGRLGRLLELILDPSKEADSGVREHLSRLNAWGTTTVYPLLLHLLDRRAKGTPITTNSSRRCSTSKASSFAESSSGRPRRTSTESCSAPCRKFEDALRSTPRFATTSRRVGSTSRRMPRFAPRFSPFPSIGRARHRNAN